MTDPDFERRLTAAQREMLLAGMRPFQASPPLVRLLWALGFRLRPPFYQSFAINALINGVVFAVLWGVMMQVWTSAAFSVPVGGVLPALVAGILFGLTMSALTAWQARAKGLSRWEDL